MTNPAAPQNPYQQNVPPNQFPPGAQPQSFPQQPGAPMPYSPEYQQAFGAQPAPTQQPYAPQPAPGQQMYGTPQNFGQPQAYQPTAAMPYPAAMHPVAPAERRKTLGIVGFTIVAVSAVIFALVSYLLTASVANLAIETGMQVSTITSSDALESDPRVKAWAAKNMLLAVLFQLSLVTGPIGWIISIIAAARKSGRSFAIWGIVLGVVAPILAFVLMVIALVPALNFVG